MSKVKIITFHNNPTSSKVPPNKYDHIELLGLDIKPNTPAIELKGQSPYLEATKGHFTTVFIAAEMVNFTSGDALTVQGNTSDFVGA
jgi:hypothetical protein